MIYFLDLFKLDIVYCQIYGLIKIKFNKVIKKNMEKHIDILIGRRYFGIGLAHLSKNCPQRQFDIIERRKFWWDLGFI